MKERGFRDRDFLISKEGFLFCVIGPYHPDDRVISYLKYMPNSTGLWVKGHARFKRVFRTYTIPNLLSTFEILRNTYNQYLFFSKVYNTEITTVPLRRIVKHLRPEERLAELFTLKHPDSLQYRSTRLAQTLSEVSGVSCGNFGVTGSILLDIHNPTLSDIDLIIYGVENSNSLKNVLSKLDPKIMCTLGLGKIPEKRRKTWLSNKMKHHPLSLGEARCILERKWNIGVYDDTFFSIHPVKLEDEVDEKYGDKVFKPIRSVTLRAVVTRSADSIFLPCVYDVENVQIEGNVDEDIKEVVSYESIYENLAEGGESIMVKGKLEEVTDVRTGEIYHRVLVGSLRGKGNEYIKPLSGKKSGL